MADRVIAFVLAGVLGWAFAAGWRPWIPSYEHCILRYMPGTHTPVASAEVRGACRALYPPSR